MQVRVGEDAGRILRKVHPDFLQKLVTALEGVHPLKTQHILIEEEVSVLAFGKNALAQYDAFATSFKGTILNSWIIQIESYENSKSENNANVYYVSHPLPTLETFKLSENILRQVIALDEGSNLHVLISGGGSSAFAIPETGISSDIYIEIIQSALSSGFDINHLNQIRSLLDQIKGGKLITMLSHLILSSLITSDVSGDDPVLIASGPLHPGITIEPLVVSWLDDKLDKSKVVVNSQDLLSQLPSQFTGLQGLHHIISREVMVSSIETSLDGMGYNIQIIDNMISSSVEVFVSKISKLLKSSNLSPRTIYGFLGEPTIKLSSHATINGLGGRVSSVTTLMSNILKDSHSIAFVGIATDGRDGSSPSSGFVINQDAFAKLVGRGLPKTIVESGQSGAVLEEMELFLDFQFTNINFNDIYLLIVS